MKLDRSAQASGVLDIRLPYPVPDVVDFLKLLFGEWRAVVKMECETHSLQLPLLSF